MPAIIQRAISIEMCAPAFLGDASQSGVWRTPPFKALMREWWRIAAAPANNHNHRRLRELEGELFGNAWLDSGATQSKVRLALKEWKTGKMAQHTPLAKVPHPEAEQADRMVEPLNYLGYGPIDRGQFKHGAALQAGETNTLSLAWPETETSIPPTLQLMDWFGTVGGRSRNGWGSLSLGLEPLAKDHPQLVAVLRNLRECLQPNYDWPHAIGKDANGPLIWESAQTFADWKAAMTFLARTKIGFRTDLKFPDERPPHRQPQERHLLAYPVTKHEIQGMGGNFRLANQLRFKLFRDGKQLRARITHPPHACPLPMNHLDQLAVWQRVHAWLDNQGSLQRLGARP